MTLYLTKKSHLLWLMELKNSPPWLWHITIIMLCQHNLSKNVMVYSVDKMKNTVLEKSYSFMIIVTQILRNLHYHQKAYYIHESKQYVDTIQIGNSFPNDNWNRMYLSYCDETIQMGNLFPGDSSIRTLLLWWKYTAVLSVLITSSSSGRLCW